jgi:hypothetical protein
MHWEHCCPDVRSSPRSGSSFSKLQKPASALFRSNGGQGLYVQKEASDLYCTGKIKRMASPVGEAPVHLPDLAAHPQRTQSAKNTEQ